MTRIPIAVELEDADREKLNKMAAEQNVTIGELIELLVASHLNPAKHLSARPTRKLGRALQVGRAERSHSLYPHQQTRLHH